MPLHARKPAVDDTSRFIFFSVLEGLYDDGVSKEEAAQVLIKREGATYFHFIYACPICNATIWALEAYQSRPASLYGTKLPVSTFGPGLPPELHAQLFSNEPVQRLTAINELVRKWMERRMTRMNLSASNRAALLEQLEKKRKEGMDMLESHRRKAHGENFGIEKAAPAYADLKECAACNGAVGKPMKLPESRRK